MKTEVLTVGKDEGYWDNIRKAAHVLERGGLVAFPTETVYGLGVNAADPAAVERLRDVKDRAETKPFTLHIPDRARLEQFVPSPGRIARRLTEKLWPGPLTIVFRVEDIQAAPVLNRVPDRRTDTLYYEGTIGVRCPDNRVAIDLLTETPFPIVAPSANLAGNRPPVTAQEVLEDLDGKIDLVLDGGTSRYSKPSTIVRIDGDGCEVLRQGVYDERTIRRYMTVNWLFVCTGNTCRSPMAAGICRKLLAERLGGRPEELESRGYSVQSAGAFAFAGAPASSGAVNAMRSRGIDVTGHRSQQLTVDLVNTADRVFAMCQSHRDAVLRMVPDAGEKVQLLDAEGDVSDPIGGDDGVYELCAGRIEAAMRLRLEEIPL